MEKKPNPQPTPPLSDKKQDGKTLSPEQIRKRKMMIAIPIMLIPFCLCMYWIFSSGETTKEPIEQLQGINLNIPEPKVSGILDDKRKAYEQEQLATMQKTKMQSLQESLSNLKISGKTETDTEDSVTVSVKKSTSYVENPIKQSAQAYQEAADQINLFYQAPKTDKTAETQELEKQVAELKTSLHTQQDAKTQQLEMMESSYQMAAKYLGNKKEIESEVVEKETYSVPVEKAKTKTVSGLPQEQKNEEVIQTLAKPRNYGFITAVGESYENSSQNTIRACIAENQKLSDGTRVKLRLLEEMRAGNVHIPQNSLIYGIAHFQSERLEILIPTIEYKGNIIPVELLAYDMDGQKGIFIPGSLGVSATKEALGNMGQSLGSTVSIAQDAKQQLVMDATKISVNGLSQFLGKKFKEVTVHLKAGYQILLAPKKLNHQQP